MNNPTQTPCTVCAHGLAALVLFAIAALVFVNSGCAPRPDTALTRAELDKVLTPPRDRVSKAAGAVEAGKLRVYFDASRSARGFAPDGGANGGRTDFTRFVENLRTWVGMNYPDAATTGHELYRFGEYVGRISGWTVPTTRRFYADGETDIVGVLRQITRASRPPEAALIITDGVPLAPDDPHDWTAMVDEIANWTAAGNTFQILMIRGEFRDNVWSIQAGRQLPEQYNSARHGKRPFYCWVFSRSQEVGRRLRDHLRVDHGDVKFLDISGSILAGCRFTLSVTDKVPASGDSALNPLMLDALDDRVWFFRWRKSSVPVGRIAVDMDVDLQHDCEDMRVSCAGIAPSGCGLRISGAARDSLSVEPSDFHALTPVYPAGSPMTGSGCVPFFLDARRPPDDKWYAYRLDLRSGYGTFLPPKWVEDISTEGDATLADWSKTIYFDRFVKSILAKPRVLGSVYIAAGR